MARDRIKVRVNFSDRDTARQFTLGLAGLEGLYDADLKPVRPLRTNQANAYYHGVVVESFRECMKNRNRQHFTHDQCHEFLRDRFIKGEDVCHPETGEVVGTMPPTSVTDGHSFFEFVESCREWIYDLFGYDVPTPESYGVVRESAGAR